MKRLGLSAWVCCLFLFTPLASAALVSYTFEGEVTRKYDVGYGIFPEEIGDHVSYSFTVDYGRQGQYSWDGFTYVFEDSLQIDYSYAEWTGGNSVDHNYLHYAQGTPNFNYNLVVNRLPVAESAIYLGDWFRILSSESIQNWALGQFATFESMGAVSSELIDYPYIAGDLHLTNISLIPEPPVLILIISGLIGLLGFNRKRIV